MIHRIEMEAIEYDEMEARELDYFYFHNEVNYQKDDIIEVVEISESTRKETRRSLLRSIKEVTKINVHGSSYNLTMLKVH